MEIYRGFSIVVTGWVLITVIFLIHLFTPSDGDRITTNSSSIYKDEDDNMEFVVYN